MLFYSPAPLLVLLHALCTFLYCCNQVASEAPEALLAGDVGVIADFLAAKLKDW